jgi:hypothetical protein
VINAYEIKTDGTPEETIQNTVKVIMELIQKINEGSGADPCAVSCTVAGELLERVIENGHQGCAAHVAIDTLRYASGEQPVSKH